jgi:hypothetical protein
MFDINELKTLWGALESAYYIDYDEDHKLNKDLVALQNKIKRLIAEGKAA